MPEPNPQREAILGSIRRSLGTSTAASGSAIAEEYAAIPRGYKQAATKVEKELLDLFQDRLHEYEAGIYRTAEKDIAATIAEVLGKRQRTGLAIPAGVPEAWLPMGFSFEDATGFDVYDYDKSQGVLTGCTVAVAETGSIVL